MYFAIVLGNNFTIRQERDGGLTNLEFSSGARIMPSSSVLFRDTLLDYWEYRGKIFLDNDAWKDFLVINDGFDNTKHSITRTTPTRDDTLFSASEYAKREIY